MSAEREWPKLFAARMVKTQDVAVYLAVWREIRIGIARLAKRRVASRRRRRVAGHWQNWRPLAVFFARAASNRAKGVSRHKN
jgi:hypothetical protein